MHRRCQDRIRGYLYKTIEQIKSSDVFTKDPRARKQLLYAIAFFKMQLKEDHYFGYYFDRSRAKTEASKGADEPDSADCYDHCPCKLKWLDYSAYFRLFGTEDGKSDDVDAVKKRNERNSMADLKTEEEEAEQNCPYKVRTEKDTCVPLCDHIGEFRCGGQWNEDKCPYGERHKINPYRSKEELILFSTWNFDHK